MGNSALGNLLIWFIIFNSWNKVTTLFRCLLRMDKIILISYKSPNILQRLNYIFATHAIPDASKILFSFVFIHQWNCLKTSRRSYIWCSLM